MKKKIIALLILATMVLSVFASCGGGGGEETKAPGGDTTAPVGGDAPTSTGKYPEDGPNYLPDATYDGATFVALMAGRGFFNKHNDFAPESAGNYVTVSEATAKRNATVEEMYDVVISYVEDFGSDTGSNRIKEDFAAGESSYHACHIGTYEAASLALSDFLYDINSIPNIDLQQEWWDKDCNEDLTIYGKIFFTTGDISIVDNLSTHALLFNKTVAAEKEITDIYDLVESGKWTFDKFAAYTKDVADDMDGNDLMNEKDKYGVMTWNDAIQATISGADIKVATVVEDEIELTINGDRITTLLDDFSEVFFDKNTTFIYTVDIPDSGRWDTERDAMFNENRALFYCTIANTVSRHRDTTTEFGIIPYPKYDEIQESYGSYVGATYSVIMCVEKYITEDLEFVGNIIEALAYESMVQVTPVYYERTLKGTYVRDDESAMCLDLIFGNRNFDPGIYFRVGDFTGRLTDMMKTRKNHYTTVYNMYLKPANERIDELNDLFATWSE